ncbi:MAG: hypothetical protein ABI566_00160 [Pseudolysinimonas sp.]
MTTPAPMPAAAAPVVPGKTLGIVALILAIVAAPVGAILGFVAKAQSKPAGVKNTPATAAIVIGIILTVLWIFLFIVLPAIILAAGGGVCTVTIDGVSQPC